MVLLCKGEVWASVLMFPPLFPLSIGVLLTPVLYLKRQFIALKILWWVLLFLLIGNAVYQNIRG